MKNNIEKINIILPKLDDYLKRISVICKEFPVCCQESSLILYMWLKKNKIDCKIIAGDYEDPVIKDDSFHFWVETEDLIIDGVAVQFFLPDYSRAREYYEIEDLIPKTSFVFDKNDNRYKHRVYAYISKELNDLLENIINKTNCNFEEFMDEVKDFFGSYARKICEANKITMYSSLYKNNKMYYGLNFQQFLNKCCINKKCEAGKYIEQY